MINHQMQGTSLSMKQNNLQNHMYTVYASQNIETDEFQPEIIR